MKKNTFAAILLFLIFILGIVIVINIAKESGKTPTDQGVSSNKVCGETCSVDSDCAASTVGAPVGCRNNKCVNLNCPNETIYGTRCDCSTTGRQCGEACGGVTYGSCAPGYSCTYINRAECGPEGTIGQPGTETYCAPIGVLSGGKGQIPASWYPGTTAKFERRACSDGMYGTGNNFLYHEVDPNKAWTQEEFIKYLCNPPAAECGNGTLDTGEQCDDNNTTNGDGCSSTCEYEVVSCDDNDAIINFETMNGAATVLNTPVTNQYESQGVIFGVAQNPNASGTCSARMQVGDYNGEADAWAYPNGPTGQADAVDRTAHPVSTTGNFFISFAKTNGAPFIGAADIAAMRNCVLTIDYVTPTTAASGYTLDNETTSTQYGTYESLGITAYNAAGEVVDTDTTGGQGGKGGDGRMARFEVTATAANPIKRIIIDYASAQAGNFGFDNFSAFCGAPPVACGNGIAETGEDCDAGNANGTVCNPSYGNSCSYCSDTCESVVVQGSSCGDGTLNSQYEECDNGAQNSDTGAVCSELCKLNAECNDGIDNDDDDLIDCTTGAEDPGCFPDGNGGGGACNPQDPSEEDAEPTCGDGDVDTGEECDDGNTVNIGDECSNSCEFNPECSDGEDNDGDGRIDCVSGNADPGCFPDNNGGGGSCQNYDDDETNVVRPVVVNIPDTSIELDESYLILTGFIFIVLGIIFIRMRENIMHYLSPTTRDLIKTSNKSFENRLMGQKKRR